MAEENKLFVGNLNWDMKDEDLAKIFSEVGEVVSANIIHYQDGRSKGFGFVEMAKAGDVQKAIDQLNDKEVMGRPIRVDKAQPRTDR